MGICTFQNMCYPSDIKAHLSGQVVLNTSKSLRARDILAYAYERVVTQRNDLVIEYFKTSNAVGVNDPGFLVNNKYFFSEELLAKSLPLELFFLSFKDNNIKPAIVINRDIAPHNAELEDFALIPGGCDPLTYGATGEGYWVFKGYQELGIDCLADIMAYVYKFRFNLATKCFEVIKDAHEVTQSLRRPYFELLLAGALNDDLTLVQLRSAVGILSRALLANDAPLTAKEKALVDSFANAPVSGIASDNSITLVNGLVTAFETVKPLASDGSDVYDDPLFSFHY